MTHAAPKRATIHAVRPEERSLAAMGALGVVLGGKYRLEAAIARGGMARVWRATHVTLNRPVAVKFVEAYGATNEERIERFLREAKVAASVRHKNVVDIIDFGTSSEDEPYTVMELLEGETLDRRLERGPMTNDEVVSVALQVLSGLDVVHRAGIVHRDLKPGNVFLTEDHDGVFARLLDFGISQGEGEAGASERTVVGTPEYMSPEQAFGDPLDARSDLYSVGVVMYEMLSGTLPFEDADPQKVVDMVAHGTPLDIATLRPDVPELCKVVARAMAREPEQRFESAREMRRALLEACGIGPDITGRHMALGRDSRVSGMMARALPVGGSIDVSSAPPSTPVPTEAALAPAVRSGQAPPADGAGGTRATIVIGAGAIAVVVAAAIVWAVAAGGREAPAGVASEAPSGHGAASGAATEAGPVAEPAARTRTESGVQGSAEHEEATGAAPALEAAPAPRAAAREGATGAAPVLEAVPAPRAAEGARALEGAPATPPRRPTKRPGREARAQSGGIVRELDF